MKPNRLKVVAVSSMNASIQSGCATWYGTKRRAVIKMMVPMSIDLLTAAPT